MPHRRMLLPVLLFLLLLGVRWVVAPDLQAAAWLDRAESVHGELTQAGGRLWEVLEPVEDPRVGPTVLLLGLGVSGSAAVWIWRLLAAALGGLAVLWVARRPGGHEPVRLGAWVLACVPLWLERASLGDPHLALGLLFLLLANRALPLGAGALGLAWALGWSPWAWIVMPLAVLTRVRSGVEDRRRYGALLPAGILLAGALNPAALLAPGAWVRAMLWRAELVGMGDAAGAVGIAVGWWPLTGTLSVALLFFLYAARCWPARLRQRDLTPAAAVAVILLVARAGFTELSGLLVILPWAAREIGTAAGELRSRLIGSRTRGCVGLPVVILLLAPLLWTYGARLVRDDGRGDPAAAALAWIEAQAPADARIALESGLRPPADSRRHWLTIPFHSRDPAMHAGAYWIGWYAAFDQIVVREDRVVRFLRERERYPELLRFYLALKARAREERVFGREPGRRVRVLQLERASAALEPGWRGRVAAGRGNGLQSGFLANLAALLARSGEATAAVDLLEEALAAGYDDAGIYLNLAAALLEQERIFAAGRVLDEALQKHPQSPELLYNLGLTAVRAKLWERATRALARLRGLWPRSAETAYLLGIALANQGLRGAARGQIEAALEMGLPVAEETQARALLESLQTE